MTDNVIITDENGFPTGSMDVEQVQRDGLDLAFRLAAICGDETKTEQLLAGAVEQHGTEGIGYVLIAAIKHMTNDILDGAFDVMESATGAKPRTKMAEIADAEDPQALCDQAVNVIQLPTPATTASAVFSAEQTAPPGFRTETFRECWDGLDEGCTDDEKCPHDEQTIFMGPWLEGTKEWSVGTQWTPDKGIFYMITHNTGTWSEREIAELPKVIAALQNKIATDAHGNEGPDCD